MILKNIDYGVITKTFLYKISLINEFRHFLRLLKLYNPFYYLCEKYLKNYKHLKYAKSLAVKAKKVYISNMYFQTSFL